MDNLIKIGISEDTINTINANYGIYTLEDLNDSYLNVYKIINTFKELKINDEVITELLENSVNIFLMDYDTVLSKLIILAILSSLVMKFIKQIKN